MTTAQAITSPPGPAPSQTVGPFFRDCLLRPDACRNVLVQPETCGDRIRVAGRVFDGDNTPAPNALVEIWQANAAGQYHHPADIRESLPIDTTFIDFGRSGKDESGVYWFETTRPGQVPFDGECLQAPHLAVMVFSRGLLNHLVTRLYFADDPANESDPFLQFVPRERRDTLLARRVDAPDGSVAYRFDIVLQGQNETVFFNV